MKTMQPIYMEKLGQENEFMYEVKYDGFRAILFWDATKITIISRNGIDLTNNFPEIIAECRTNTNKILDELPIQLDGELVILNLPFQANFAAIQTRGRLKSRKKIESTAKKRPANFIAFDILQRKGADIRGSTFIKRKQNIQRLFQKLDANVLQLITTFDSYKKCAFVVFENRAEGIVAKRKNSPYIEGKNHHHWQKEKNWRSIMAFLTTYHPGNGYFDIAVFQDQSVLPIGKCKHGLSEREEGALRHLFITEGKKHGPIYSLPPAICSHIHTLDILQEELREPKFAALLPEMKVEECTITKLKHDLASFPRDVTFSNEDKVFWPAEPLTKGNLLVYIRHIYPYMKPYLHNRALTIIRCPDGVDETCFFQKHLPEYAPDILKEEHEQYIVCNTVEAILWLANHSAIEFHLPYQPVNDPRPHEIVFDLDPPSRKQFSLAIDVAILIKQVLDQLDLTAFIKTSGSKGLQIHIPIPIGRFTYEETGFFTKRIAEIIEESAPDLCTTERLKKNRGEKLYLDYVQHGKKKTIIAPYSPRKTGQANVATPLYWEEVKKGLTPEQFTIKNVVGRVESQGCPWIFHYGKARAQDLTKALPLFNY